MADAGSEDKVEDKFAAIVADNTAVNPAAAEIVVQKFPKLFFNGCRAHCGDLIIEDIAKIPEVKDVVDTALTITKFVRNHHQVKQLFVKIGKAHGGTMLKDFPLTRFAFADLTLESLVGNDLANVNVLSLMLMRPALDG